MRKLFLATALLAAPAIAHNGVPHEASLAKATTDQIHITAAAVERYKDFRVAQREGWKKFGGDEPLMGEHWYHPDGPDYRGTSARLDFARPSNLMYAVIGGQRVLTGVTFNVRLRDGDAVPEGFAGGADRWHVHDMLRAIDAALQDRPFLRWLADGWLKANFFDKGDDYGRLAMVHVWVGVANPDGIFADHNRTVPYLKLGLPASAAGSMDAAHGLTLATPGGCKELIDGQLWIANAPRATSRRLHAVCDTEGRTVRAALNAPPATLNATSAAAWQRWESAWNAALTPEQRDRIAAITEHGGDHSGHGGAHDHH